LQRFFGKIFVAYASPETCSIGSVLCRKIQNFVVTGILLRFSVYLLCFVVSSLSSQLSVEGAISDDDDNVESF